MRKTRAGAAAFVAAMLGAGHAGAVASDDAALSLQPQAGASNAPSGPRSLRAFGELAVGRLGQRYGQPTEDSRRASLDLTWDAKLAPQWRAVLSNRLDDIHPAGPGGRSTLNSVREAFFGWQSGDARQGVDLGRVNVRFGPAYGFNPTDYFREGSSRAVTTADPLALRENRLGTVMLRAQRLWDGGAVSVAVAPKLKDEPSRESFSLDLGATNHADRALVSVSMQPGGSVSAQAFAYHDRGTGWQLGANGTALWGDATVAFFEWSGGKDTELLSATFDTSPKVSTRHRAVAGLTYTTPSKLSITGELQYNGFALDRRQWRQAVDQVGVEAMGAYLYEVQRRQDIASRKAVMVYASQKDAFVKNLDVTALVRYNTEDRSRFVWAEARYHFRKVDVALQWQANQGRASSEYGGLVDRNLVQVLAAFYF